MTIETSLRIIQSSGLSSDGLPLGYNQTNAFSTHKYTDTGDEFQWDGANWRQTHAAGVPSAAIVGERYPDSPTNGYQVVREEPFATVIDVQTTVTIGGLNTINLFGLFIAKALAGTVVITGFGNLAGTAVSVTLPVGSVGDFNFHGMLNTVGSLTVTASNVADANNVVVLWRTR